MATKVAVFSNMAISDLKAASMPEKGLRDFFRKRSRNIFTALSYNSLPASWLPVL